MMKLLVIPLIIKLCVRKNIFKPRHIFNKVIDSDHFDQYLKYSVCEKADEILYKFCMKHPQIQHFYNNKLPAAMIISRRDAALVYCLRSYLQEKDPSLIV